MAFPTLKLLATVILINIGTGFNIGIQLIYVNPAVNALKQFLNESMITNYDNHLSDTNMNILWSNFASSLTLGSFLQLLFILIYKAKPIETIFKIINFELKK